MEFLPKTGLDRRILREREKTPGYHICSGFMAFWITFQYTRTRLAGWEVFTSYEECRDLLEHLIHREGPLLRQCG